MSETCGHVAPGGEVCTFPPHGDSDQPHGRMHIPGKPCRFCGLPTPVDGGFCRRCWKPITVADFKAFCAESGWDTVISK